MGDLLHHTIVDAPDDWTPEHADLISVPANRTVVDVSNFRRDALETLKPFRRKGTARVADLASLIAWANRFKGETSALFASPDLTKPTLTCIADYHGAGPADPTKGEDQTARHCQHRAIYDFPLSEEWKDWTGLAGMALSKDQLGEFIEAHAFDIMDPTPAIIAGKLDGKAEKWETRLIETAQKIEGRFAQLSTLLKLSRQFQVHETSHLTVKTNRDTGEAEIQFLNEHKTPGGAPLQIPNLLIIAIPVFDGGDPYRMVVRFRYRKNGQNLSFYLSVFNPEVSFRDAFDEAVTAATEATGLPTFRGLPEA
jgi:hypothetical protein